MMGDSEVNINGLLTRLFDAFNRHDLDAIMELFAEDAILASLTCTMERVATSSAATWDSRSGR